jgi:hypothetical protein
LFLHARLLWVPPLASALVLGLEPEPPLVLESELLLVLV